MSTYNLIRSATVAALLTTPVLAQEALATSLGKLISARPDRYDETIDAILATNPTVTDLEAAGRSGITPGPTWASELSSGWQQGSAIDTEGTSRPYQLYVPESVANGQTPSALVVHMHGAVARPDFGTGLGSPSATGYGSMLWPKVAEDAGFVVACPQGRDDCMWWTDAGVRHVRAVIRDVRRSVPVPDRSIIGAGFSDGASGCYYMAMAAPDPFAGFIAMNGHFAVAASASGKQVYIRNLAASSTIAAMTQADSLYPSASLLPHIQAAMAERVDIHVISYPKMNHQPLYFTDQTATFVNFIKTATRDDDAQRLRWLTSEPSIGSARWLEILEVGPGEHDGPALPEINVMTTESRVRLGLRLNGRTNVVESTVAGSAAATAGIKAGDAIMSMDGASVASSRDLRGALSRASYGGTFTVTVQRGEEQVTLDGQFPEFVPEPIYLRKNPTAYVDCAFDSKTADISITSHHARKVRIGLPTQLARHAEIEANINGKTHSLTVRQRSPRDWLEQFARTGDASAIRAAHVEVEIN